MTLTEALAELGLAIENRAISPEAYEAAEKMTLDTLGCGLAGWRQPGTAETLGLMRDWGGTHEASVLFHGDRLPSPHAAFVNSTMIHALDYDDVYIPGVLHIMSIILPVALAAGEVADASGEDLLASVTMGVEVAGRLGIAYCKRQKPPQSPGFLNTSIVGGFGGVVTACRLLRMSVKQCVDALGINYAQTSGNRQALQDMTLTKRVQPAFTARSTLWAAALAARGITGPPNALEGQCGFFALYTEKDPPSAEEVTAPREWFEIECDSVKRYPSCGACHAAHAAAEQLAADGLRPQDIDRVELVGFSHDRLVGLPFKLGDNPQVSAQFSVRYCVALALLRGKTTLEHFTDEAVVANRDVAQLAERITLLPALEEGDLPAPPVLSSKVPDRRRNLYHAVIVHTTDGRRLVRAQCVGQTFDPDAVTLDHVKAKFRDCARFSGICEPARAEEFIRAVASLREAESARDFVRQWCLDP